MMITAVEGSGGAELNRPQQTQSSPKNLLIIIAMRVIARNFSGYKLQSSTKPGCCDGPTVSSMKEDLYGIKMT